MSLGVPGQPSTEKPYVSTNVRDLAIIGGGPAGMNAALVAGRACLDTVVVNAEQPRNAVTTASHGFLTRDGAHPMELLAIAKEQLAKYDTVHYVRGTVEDVSRRAGVFTLRLSDHTEFQAKRIVLATGYRENLEELGLPGIEEVYGKSVFPCPFCDGYEHRDERLAVFGALHIVKFAPVVRVWSQDVVVFTNGDPLDEKTKTQLAERDIRVMDEAVTRLISEEGLLQAVALHGGIMIERDAGFIAYDYAAPAARFDEALGVRKKTNDSGSVLPEADESGRTDVEGVWIIGDARSGYTSIVESAADGSRCASDIVNEIAAER